jgi:enoyl-CoA hydratase
MSVVLADREGALGVITLNRPEALNALNHEMVLLIAALLDEWEADPGVERVLLVGSGERAFCAGGDVVSIYRDARAIREGRDGAASADPASLRFWRDEYRLNARIARYPKPIIALMDGIVLGGGVGLASHASHRVVTETSSVGLPEVTIGFVPDVGSTWLLSRAPGELGTHLALTAAPVGGADAILVGLADTCVPRDHLDRLRSDLAARGAQEAIAAVSVDPEPAPLRADRPWIDSCYARDDVSEILVALRAEGQDAVADRIESKSPTALVLALVSLRRARRLPDLESALEQELRVSARCLTMPDFAEGVRAQVIDKDRTPRWSPSRLADVDPTSISEFFEPLPGEQLFVGRQSR